MPPVRILWVIAALFLAGCGTRDGGPDGSVAQQAGDQVGRTVTDFARGVGHGVDKQLEVAVELSEELTNLGLSKSVAKLTSKDLPPSHAGSHVEGKAISVYLISQKPLRGQLKAKALNAEGEEIGRSTADVDFAADDARYVSFPFPEELDSQRVAKYVLSLRQTAASPSSQPE